MGRAFNPDQYSKNRQAGVALASLYPYHRGCSALVGVYWLAAALAQHSARGQLRLKAYIYVGMVNR